MPAVGVQRWESQEGVGLQRVCIMSACCATCAPVSSAGCSFTALHLSPLACASGGEVVGPGAVGDYWGTDDRGEEPEPPSSWSKPSDDDVDALFTGISVANTTIW